MLYTWRVDTKVRCEFRLGGVGDQNITHSTHLLRGRFREFGRFCAERGNEDGGDGYYIITSCISIIVST